MNNIYIKKYLKLLIILSIIFVVIWKFDLNIFMSIFSFKNFLYIAMVQPIIILSLIFSGIRLAILTKSQKAPIEKLVVMCKSIIITHGMSLILPARLSEVVKPIYIRNNLKISLGSALGAVFLERVMDIIILFIMSILGFYLFVNKINLNYFIVILILTSILLILINYSNIFNFIDKIPIKFLKSLILNFIDTIKNRTKIKYTFSAFLAGAIAWAISFISVSVILNLYGLEHIGIKGYLAVFILSTIGGAIPALPGGFGAYEAAVIYVLSYYEIGFEEAFPIAVCLHISQLMIFCFGTLYISIFEDFNIHSFINEIKSLKI